MIDRFTKKLVRGLLCIALPFAAAAANAHLEVNTPVEAATAAPLFDPAKYAFIPAHRFDVVAPDGTTSSARLVLDRGAGLLSCFTQPPASIVTTQRIAARIESAEGTYTCFEGREPLESAALGRNLTQTWSTPVVGQEAAGACSAGGASAKDFAKLRTLEDEMEELWTNSQQRDLEFVFWGSYAGAGGASCMRACSEALAIALRMCAGIPGLAGAMCVLGATSLYVACIAGC